jgi:hypothetical protein
MGIGTTMSPGTIGPRPISTNLEPYKISYIHSRAHARILALRRERELIKERAKIEKDRVGRKSERVRSKEDREEYVDRLLRERERERGRHHAHLDEREIAGERTHGREKEKANERGSSRSVEKTRTQMRIALGERDLNLPKELFHVSSDRHYRYRSIPPPLDLDLDQGQGQGRPQSRRDSYSSKESEGRRRSREIGDYRDEGMSACIHSDSRLTVPLSSFFSIFYRIFFHL